MLRVLALLSALTMLLGAATSQKIFPYEYDQYDLPNGLRVITVPTDFPNVVALYIVVQAGSRNEVEPGKTGFAHFFEHMMFRGTKNNPPEKYQAALREIGAASNAYTTDDRTVYHNTFPKEALERVLELEADRFQNLEYSLQAYQTEALAVLGEYNKNSASPMMKLMETIRGTAFEKHTYRHTTMGFLEDIQNMPQMFDYSRQFFDRYYRPEYTTIIVVGDVEAKAVRAMVEKHWGNWKRGTYKAAIPKEPPQTAPKEAEVRWNSPTLPWLTISFRGPAYSDTEIDQAALDLISYIGFAEGSPLYQKLVIEEQKVDLLRASSPDQVDPYLFGVYTRVKKTSDLAAVQRAILDTLDGFKNELVPEEKLARVKKRLRYEFALSLDNSEAIAGMLAAYVGLRRTPETINRLYELYERITPEDLRAVARKYFVDSGRTIVRLLPPEGSAGGPQS